MLLRMLAAGSAALFAGVFSTLVLAGSLSCNNYPPSCWTCTHSQTFGTVYVADDFCGNSWASLYFETPWIADFHCFANNGRGVCLYIERQGPAPGRLETYGDQCGLSI
jgi:hypothetical protein